LNAPELKEVIAKRRQYVEYTLKHQTLPRNLKKHMRVIELLNWHIKLAFLGSDDQLRKMVTSLCLNNVRYALTMIRDYYRSYHGIFGGLLPGFISTGKLPSEGVVIITQEISHFLQNLMLGNNWSYDQTESEIFNVFDVDPNEQSSHFLALRVLAYLSRFSPKQIVQYEKLCKDFVYMGDQRHQLDASIRRLLGASLILSPNIPQSTLQKRDTDFLSQIPKDLRLVLSARGYYYLYHIVSHEYYQTRVGEDTCWYDEEKLTAYSRALKDALDVQEVYGRQDVLLHETQARNIFLQYLRKALYEEAQSGRLRSQSELSRIVNSIVEQNIFGELVTSTVYMLEDGSDDTPPPSLVTKTPPIKINLQRRVQVTNESTDSGFTWHLKISK